VVDPEEVDPAVLEDAELLVAAALPAGVDVPDEPVEVVDALHPAARMPTVSNMPASETLFTRSPISSYVRTNKVRTPLKTPQQALRLDLVPQPGRRPAGCAPEYISHSVMLLIRLITSLSPAVSRK
jgi:hypothetical protein